MTIVWRKFAFLGFENKEFRDEPSAVILRSSDKATNRLRAVGAVLDKTYHTKLGWWTCAAHVKFISVVSFAFILINPSPSVFYCFWILGQLRKSKLVCRIQKVGRRQRWWIIRVFCKCTQVLSKIAVQSEMCQNVYSAAVLAGSQTLALTQCSTTLSKSNSLRRFALSVGFITSSPQRAESIGVAQKGPCWSQKRVEQKLGLFLGIKTVNSRLLYMYSEL